MIEFPDTLCLYLDLSVPHTDHDITGRWGRINSACVIETNSTLGFNLQVMRGHGAWLSLTNVAEVDAYARISIKGQREM